MFCAFLYIHWSWPASKCSGIQFDDILWFVFSLELFDWLCDDNTCLNLISIESIARLRKLQQGCWCEVFNGWLIFFSEIIICFYRSTNSSRTYTLNQLARYVIFFVMNWRHCVCDLWGKSAHSLRSKKHQTLLFFVLVHCHHMLSQEANTHTSDSRKFHSQVALHSVIINAFDNRFCLNLVFFF
jgi:hypothetical protein